MRPQPFQRKTYGRIFVQREADIDVVTSTVRLVDPSEFDYMPKKLITVYLAGTEADNPLIYLHKFEIDKIALTQACARKGIWIWCVDGGAEFDVV